MRPVIAFILLFTLLAPLLFTTAWKQWHRWQVRQELKQQLLAEQDNPNLLWLVLPQSEAEKLRWEGPHEFEYRGTMYDLVSAELLGDSLRLRCWPDHLETGLGKQLDQLLSRHSDPQQQHRQLTLHDFFKNLPNISFASQNGGTPFTEGERPIYRSTLKSRFAMPPLPPPPQCFSPYS